MSFQTPGRLLFAQTKTEAAYEALRLAIEEGRIRPGQRLRIGELQQELGVSPTPIREALRLLQADGLVDHQPHRGMVVAEYDVERVEEVYRLRAVLEPMATELAVRLASDEAVAEMRLLHDRLMDAIGAGVRTDGAGLNVAWHRSIYAASDARYLQDFITRLWNALPVQAVWTSANADASATEHRAIMDAIEQRNPKRAARLMRRHISDGERRTKERLRRALD